MVRSGWTALFRTKKVLWLSGLGTLVGAGVIIK